MSKRKKDSSVREYLRPAEVAERLGISLNAIYNLIQSGVLRAVDLSRAGQAGGRRLYGIKPEWLQEFLDKRATRPPVPVPRRSVLRRSKSTIPNYTGL